MALQIGILVFPRVQQLDLTGPYEVFASLPAANVHLVWKDRSAITSATGLVLAPTMTFGECPALDVLCIPGGAGINALLEDAEVLGFVRAQAARARYVTSVCSGAARRRTGCRTISWRSSAPFPSTAASCATAI
jgi:cyclohexyl-isocyanide hydratase